MGNNIKFLCCILSVFILISCCNNPKVKNNQVDLSSDKIMPIKEKLDSNIVNGIMTLIQTNEHLKYPDIPLKKSFIVVGFIATPKYFLDSIVSIFYFYNTFQIHNSENNYKGMISINGYNIAIFDKSNFGGNYYNVDSLQQISLDNFKSYPMENIFTETYYVQNGKLNYYGLEIIVPPTTAKP